MIRVLSFVIAVFSAGISQAETAAKTLPEELLSGAETADLSSFLWTKRLVIVFSDSAADPRGFMLMLVGKDGQVYLRKPLPWSVREISRSIDKLPQRQQEIRDRRD